MKAVVFAGGGASRLSRYIGTYNKHFMPLGKSLVIEQGVRDLQSAGVREFLVITNRGWEDDFQYAFHERLGIRPPNLTIVSSEAKNSPLPDVLLLASQFVGNERFLLYLGDNLFLSPSPVPTMHDMIASANPNLILLTLSAEPSQFGVVRLGRQNSKIDSIVEKPEEAGYRWVVTGLAVYSSRVFQLARELIDAGNPKRSLSDINNMLLLRHELHFTTYQGIWYDVGTDRRYFQSLDSIWRSHGALDFDLASCPRPNTLLRTPLAQKIERLSWEIGNGRFK